MHCMDGFYASIARSNVKVTDLTASRLDEAAELVASASAEACREVSYHSGVIADLHALRARLEEMWSRQSGVAAIRDGNLIGFMMATNLDRFRGKRTRYSPDWAHAASGPMRGGV